MKKTINYSIRPGLILISALFLLPLSCNKDKVTDNPGKDNISQLIKVSGEDANSTTKTTLDGIATSWIGGTDKVGIYSSEARTATGGGGSQIINAGFTAASSGVGSSFTGTMYWGAASTSHTFYAYYPYSSGFPYATVVPVSLPAAQTQSSANSTAHIGALDFMVATPLTVTSPESSGATSGVNLKYNHIFSVLEFQIQGSGELQAVKLVGSITPVSFSGGTINIAQETPATDVAYTLASLTGTVTQCVVTLTNAATLTATNTDTKVYMVINPGTQTGNCLVGLKIGGVWTYISKAAPAGGFKRGKKYVVSVNSADATATPPVDADGNVYNTVTIGTQVWMAENLKTTKYNDGTPIPNRTDNGDWGSATTGAWCDYNNLSSNSTTYGKLYNWYAVDNNASTKVASNGGKNICPVGWHVPSEAELVTLTNYLGASSNLAGSKLKEAGTTHWTDETGATNSSGFTALPGGYRLSDGQSFESFGTFSYWWASSSNPYTGFGIKLSLFYYGNYVNMTEIGSYYNGGGLSVRCVKD